MWSPLYEKLGERVNMISRLRSNNNLFAVQPVMGTKRKAGRPRIYGNKLGNTSALAGENQSLAQDYKVNLYGQSRSVLAYDQVVMLKILKRMVRVVWIYASRLVNTPSRRHVVHGRDHFAFSDVRRILTRTALDDNFALLCPLPGKPVDNSFVTALLRLAL